LAKEAKVRMKRMPANSAVVVASPQQNSGSGKTRDRIGKTVGISGRTVDHARKSRKKPGRARQPGLSKALHHVGKDTL
jgi:hypothetical protein